MALTLVNTPVLAAAIVLGGASCVTWAAAQDRSLKTAHSLLKIRVFKSGLFSAFAHTHEIEAPIADGAVHLSANPTVALRVRARCTHSIPTSHPGSPQTCKKPWSGRRCSTLSAFRRFPSNRPLCKERTSSTGVSGNGFAEASSCDANRCFESSSK
jgi:hypothetical protein